MYVVCPTCSQVNPFLIRDLAVWFKKNRKMRALFGLSFDKVETTTEAGISVTTKGEGELRYLIFDKPVKLIELNKLEATKLAYTLLGRIGICEVCGTPFLRQGTTYPHVNRRFCCKVCYYEWCRRTGGPVFGRHRIIETDNGFEVTVKEKGRKELAENNSVKEAEEGEGPDASSRSHAKFETI